MGKVLRWAGYALAALFVLALIFAAWVWFASAREIGRSYGGAQERIVRAAAGQAAEGERRMRILGCFGCHEAGLRGQLFLDDPSVGRIWAPNLTEVASRSTDQQLARAIRQGIGVDGRGLWIMPSEMYSRLTDEDVGLVVAGIRGQPRGGGRTPPISVGPLGRLGIATGNFTSGPASVEEYRAHPPYDLGSRFEAGRYLAATACSECHGPDLAGGGEIEGRVPPNLTIAAAYGPEQFRSLMRTGRPPSGRDLGVMGEVARGRFSHLTDAEIAALDAYLRARAERVPR